MWEEGDRPNPDREGGSSWDASGLDMERGPWGNPAGGPGGCCGRGGLTWAASFLQPCSGCASRGGSSGPACERGAAPALACLSWASRRASQPAGGCSRRGAALGAWPSRHGRPASSRTCPYSGPSLAVFCSLPSADAFPSAGREVRPSSARDPDGLDESSSASSPAA